MSDSFDPISSQSALSNVNAQEIKVGDITQTIINQQRPKALSTAIDSGLPPIKNWQTRPQEALLHSYFADVQVRLVGLYAAGGYGKSALAARVYGEATGFGQKLWANFQEPASFDVFGRWLIQQLLGVELYAQVRELYERDSPEELAVKALNLLDQGRYLLVLDNLETLFQSSELWQPYGDFIAKWLGRGSDNTLLLTSQYRLELPTEAWRWEALQGLSEAQGVALLEAQQIEGTEEDLRAFVQATDGHPLLLQLAASLLLRQRLENADSAAIYRLGRDDVSLLRGIKELHRGDAAACVGDVLDRSFGMLHPQWLQGLLWRLSVLRVRFGVELVQAMVDEAVELAELRKLARWSFVQEQRLEKGWGFEFLPLIQRYLQQGAREAGELWVGHERAGAFFDSHRQPWTGDLEDCRSQFESFYHCCELGRYAAAYQVMDTCVDVLINDYYHTLVPIYEHLTRAWKPTGEVNEAETHNLGSAWTVMGNIYQFVRRYGDAIASHQQAQQLFQSIAHRLGEAESLSGLGNSYRSLEQYQRAIEFQQQSLAINREISNQGGEAGCLINLGNCYKSLGQYQRAIAFYQESLSIARQIGRRMEEAASLANLGSLYCLLEEYQRAIEFQQQSLEIAREIENSKGHLAVANFLFAIAYTLAKLDRRWEARQHYEQAQQIYESLQIDHEVEKCKTALYNLGQIIPAQVIRVPQIRDESDAPARTRKRRKMPWWGWFLVGVAIVLAIAWWLKG
jgi:tetratricopeptide (TPR) repeat protein